MNYYDEEAFAADQPVVVGTCVCSRSAYGAASVSRPFSERRIRRRAASDSLPLVLFQATLSRSRHSSWHREWLNARFVVCRPSAWARRGVVDDSTSENSQRGSAATGRGWYHGDSNHVRTAYSTSAPAEVTTNTRDDEDA